MNAVSSTCPNSLCSTNAANSTGYCLLVPRILMSAQTASAATPTAPQLASTAAAAAAAGGCCESGRPIITDPLTGQTVCSCQYDPQTQLLNYQRLASAGLPIYGGPYGEQGYIPLSAEQSAFYTPSSNGFELKDNLSTWPYAASVYYPYDTTLAGYPFTNGYGVDLNGARRKNATRETTSTLKAWLSEHKKNPYPTKGEKIMLAIITKMTLTQVSTWFANARRRLKKENKMTWEPRNRVDDEDNNGDTTDKEDKPRDHDRGAADSPLHIGRDVVPHHHMPSGTMLSLASDCDKLSDDTCVRVVTDDEDDDDDDDDKSISVSISHDGLDTNKPDSLLMSDSLSSPSSVLSDQASSIHSPLSVDSGPPSAQGTDVVPHKPRIWSIVDTATSNSTPTASQMYSNQGLSSSSGNPTFLGSTSVMSKVSPLARSLRLDYSSPYPKTAWFNGSYGNHSGSGDSLLRPSFMGGASPYSLTSGGLSTARPCLQNVTALNKGLPSSMAALQRNPTSAPRFHGAFTLNSKLDCQVHQDQRQELQGPAS